MSLQNQVCYIGKASYRSGVITDSLLNATLFATSGSLSIITTDYNQVGIKDNVAPSHWTGHLKQSHGDVQTLLQCQGLTVLEGWHYTVFDDQKNICYFGILKTEERMLMNDDDSQQVSINTNQLDSFISSTFVTRQSSYEYPFTYVRFAYPLNVEHCSVHCFFDSENKCDFFFIVDSYWYSYCYLGNFNQVSYAYYLTDTVTTYIYKGNVKKANIKSGDHYS